MEWSKALATPFLLEVVIKEPKEEGNMKSQEPSQEIDYTFYEEPYEFIDDEDIEDLFDKETSNKSANLNNIFLPPNNLHHKRGKEWSKVSIHGFRELSFSFSLLNVNRILKRQGISFKDVSTTISDYGKRKPCISNVEVERVVRVYSITHDFDDDVVTSFINMWKESSINKVISYHLVKANARSKRNSSAVGTQNIMCNFNADSLREICFGVTTNNKKFNPLDDKELFIAEDWARIYWNLYMLLVFYKVCEIDQVNEGKFFQNFHNVINLCLFTGMKMFAELELKCCFGELYQELQGFKTLDNRYMHVQDIKEHQQICFTLKKSDFLTEAYRNEYGGAVYIPKHVRNIKTNKNIHIELWVNQGMTDKSVRIEVIFSGQHPIGRIYSCETNPKTVINFKNIFNYCPNTLKPVLYLFRQVLNYSKDYGIISYYTEIQKYLKQFKGKRTRNLVPKVISIVLLILKGRLNEKEFETTISKYFKQTDTVQKTEMRNMYKELKVLLKPKKVRLIDKLREELDLYVW